VEGFLMASIYDAFADSCAALATKAKRESDKVRLLQLADQWRTVPADHQGPGRKLPPSVTRAGDAVNRVTPVRDGATDTQKSAVEEIKELKAQPGSKTTGAKAKALEKAKEAIGILQQLGIDNDTILKDLGFQRRRGSQRGQTRKKPLTAEQPEKKELTKAGLVGFDTNRLIT
jgi:hypothetical protein